MHNLHSIDFTVHDSNFGTRVIASGGRTVSVLNCVLTEEFNRYFNIKNARCATKTRNKVSETFPDRKIYLNSSFRRPVCSFRQSASDLLGTSSC